jgi:OmcA/MtrC family decaheme c-type cytochrome
MKLIPNEGSTRSRKALLALMALGALGLAACAGDTGSTGDPGPDGPDGPSGPPGGTALVIGYSRTITATITGVTIPDDGKPVVDLYLTDENNRKLRGLPAGNIGFVLARLEPAVNARSSTWRALTNRCENNDVNQGYTEGAAATRWVDNQDGTYRYTFARSVKVDGTKPCDTQVPYDASLAHRVGLEIRLSSAVTGTLIPANNAVYTWQPALNTLVDSGREIVDNDTCNACHDNLAFHGGARFDLQYCAMCHESYSFDAQSGNALDLKVMIHKIHAGASLPSVQAGGSYGIYGFGNRLVDFSEVVFTQDKRNCQTCHEEQDADTPQAQNWRLTVNREACGSCHDNVNFDTGANHGDAGGLAATDDQCASCHGPTAHSDALKTQVAHLIPEAEAAKKFEYQVLRVVDTAPGQAPTVTIRVVDPTDGNKPYDIKAAGGPFQNRSGSLAVDVAWSTRPDFTNTGSQSATATTGAPAQPLRIDFKLNGVPDPAFPGSFKATSARPIPLTATGSGSALLEGHPAVDVDGDGDLETLAVKAVGQTFRITDATAVGYKAIVDIGKCNDCHQNLSLHGNNRTSNAELCATCHNPNATDIAQRVAGTECDTLAGGLDDVTIDFKYMVHAIHRGALAGYKVCGYRNSAHDYSDVTYPGKLENCEGCHLAGTYYPPDPTTAIATTIDAAPATNPDRSTPLGDIAISPATAVCSSCHKGDSAKLHMELSGGSFDAVKDADSRIPGAPLETCGTCHGEGRSADVKVLHGVGEFNYN